MTSTLPETPSTLDAIYHRRTVRSYDAILLGEDRIHRLLDAAVHAPTAVREEPWQFVVVQDPAALARLSDRAKTMAKAQAWAHGYGLKAPGAAGDGVASPLADPELNIFYNASTLVVICAKPSSDLVTADCWLAAENLMLAAYADGLGTCCVGSAIPMLNTPETKLELGIPAGVQAFAPIIVGVVRGEGPDPVPRKAPVILNWVR